MSRERGQHGGETSDDNGSIPVSHEGSGAGFPRNAKTPHDLSLRMDGPLNLRSLTLQLKHSKKFRVRPIRP